MAKPPRVKASPIHLELRNRREEYRNFVVFGEAIGIHIRDEVMTDSMVDLNKFKPIARLGDLDDSITANVFTMPLPRFWPSGNAAKPK